MKTLIAATALSLVAGAAFAGEGNGNPFPFAAPPIAVSMQGYKQAAPKPQNPFPFAAPGQTMRTNSVLPSDGSAGEVQSANSLPPGAADGVPGQTDLDRSAPVRLAQPTAPLPGTNG